MNREQRAQRMLAALPVLLQSGANVGRLMTAVAEFMSGDAGDPQTVSMEYGLTRLMRARWYRLAAGWPAADPPVGVDEAAASELGRLAAMFGLEPSRGESAAYFRGHLAEFIALHRVGLTTAPALLKLVALVYLAESPPEISWPHGDGVAVATFRVREADGPRAVRVELVDNPDAHEEVRFSGVVSGRQLVVRNTGLTAAVPEIALHVPKSGGPAAVPVLTQRETDNHLIFVGVVPPGSTLTLRSGRPPLLDGAPVDAPVILVNPTNFEPTSSPEKALFGTRGAPRARFSVFERNLALPTLPPGESRWTYDTVVRERLHAFLANWPDLADHEQLALAVKATPTAELEFRWSAAQPASVALRIPADYVPPHLRGEGGRAVAGDSADGRARLVAGLQQALDYGRAAGVRARVELALHLPAERVHMHEAVRVGVSLRHADANPPAETFRPGGPVVRLKDELPPPSEHLWTSGVFDHTTFGASLFY